MVFSQISSFHVYPIFLLDSQSQAKELQEPKQEKSQNNTSSKIQNDKKPSCTERGAVDNIFEAEIYEYFQNSFESEDIPEWLSDPASNWVAEVASEWVYDQFDIEPLSFGLDGYGLVTRQYNSSFEYDHRGKSPAEKLKNAQCGQFDFLKIEHVTEPSYLMIPGLGKLQLSWNASFYASRNQRSEWNVFQTDSVESAALALELLHFEYQVYVNTGSSFYYQYSEQGLVTLSLDNIKVTKGRRYDVSQNHEIIFSGDSSSLIYQEYSEDYGKGYVMVLSDLTLYKKNAEEGHSYKELHIQVHENGEVQILKTVA